jgi:hypothetical protein
VCAHHLDEPGIDTLDRHRRDRDHRGDIVGGGGQIRITEHDQQGRRRDRHQFHLGFEQYTAGALGPDERPGHRAATFRQQIFEPVARRLPVEPAQIGAQYCEGFRGELR